MRYVYLPAVCVLFSVCLQAQTKVCLIKGDSVFAGSTDKASIHAAGRFNFVYNGPLDTSVTAEVEKIGAGAGDLKMFGESSVAALKKVFTAFFLDVLEKDPGYFEAKGSLGNLVAGHLCLFGVENNKPVLLEAVFFVNKGVRHPVVVSYSLEEQVMAVFSEGKYPRHQGVAGHLNEGSAMVQIKRLVGIAMDGPIDGSGPPMDVLVVWKKGRVWIRQ